MFRKIVAAGLLIALGMVGTVNAQMPDPPKVVSSSDSKTAGKKTVFQVKPGEKITFSVKAKGAEKYQWLVNKAIRKGAEADSFTWTVPDKKGMWKILLKTTSKARQKWGREKAASCDKWLSAQEHGKKFPKEKNRFVRDIADIYTWPVQSETEWIVATFLTTVKPGESIQKAIDSLPPEGGIVELAAGTHEITDSISIKRSDVTIAGTHDSIIRHHNKNLACFSLRGRKSAVKNITFTGFAMASTYTRADRARNAMISAATVTNFTVANMRDTSWARVFVGSGGGKGWGFTDPSMDVTIKNNIAEHCGLGASKTGNLRILNNTILGSPHCNAIATDHALRYLYIVGNRVINAGVNAGILVDKPVHCLVSNNFVRSRQKGIRSNNSGRQTIIENNTLTGASYAGIWITCQPKMPESLIRNNLIYNNRDGVYTSSEFRGRQQYTHIRLTNNVICNNKRDGIRTGAEEVSMIVSNNIIANNGGYGINYKVKGPLTLSHNNLWNNGQG
ncbi:MAG: right-handed parallel beta-helix repeat-containing protein, partial [Phycisphaerae bacterium]|nr:right-handed parallel beta-helix repeat-containing protein [Phycisphaerae bacterium]